MQFFQVTVQCCLQLAFTSRFLVAVYDTFDTVTNAKGRPIFHYLARREDTLHFVNETDGKVFTKRPVSLYRVSVAVLVKCLHTLTANTYMIMLQRAIFISLFLTHCTLHFVRTYGPFTGICLYFSPSLVRLSSWPCNSFCRQCVCVLLCRFLPCTWLL